MVIRYSPATARPSTAHRRGPDMESTSWTVWGLEASITVTEPSLASAAELVVREEIAGVDDACSRFREDSELVRLQPRLSSGATVSPLLAMLVESALDAAAWTDGDVDPTLGRDLEALGYDRDLAEVRLGPRGAVIHDPRGQQRSTGWSQVRLVGRKLSVPEHLRLDLGATAKAVAADLAAQRVAAELGCGILVSLGGDIATAGPAPEGAGRCWCRTCPGIPGSRSPCARAMPWQPPVPRNDGGSTRAAPFTTFLTLGSGFRRTQSGVPCRWLRRRAC